MKCRCGKQMKSIEEDRYFDKEYICECGVDLTIIEDYDDFEETDLYIWRKDGEIIEKREVDY